MATNSGKDEIGKLNSFSALTNSSLLAFNSDTTALYSWSDSRPFSKDVESAPGPLALYSLCNNLMFSLNYSTSFFVTSANSFFFSTNLESFFLAWFTNSFHLSLSENASSNFSCSTFYWYILSVLNFSVTSPILNSIFIVIFLISWIKFNSFFKSSISLGCTSNYSR